MKCGHGNLKILNLGMYHCPRCRKKGTLRHAIRRICMDCMRAEKLAVQKKWYAAKRDRKNQKAPSQWDQDLSTRMLMTMRPTA